MTAADTAHAAPARQSTFAALYRLVFRMQFSVQQMLGIGALSALAVIIGLFARFDDNPEQAAADAVASYGLGVLVPLAALWLGTSALGNIMEDRLLVYLWLKPVPRWQLPAAAVLATAVLVILLTALPLTASVLVAGGSDLAWPTLLAASLGALAYSGLFVAAGIWFSRAVWWALAFVVIWENILAYTAEGIARVTVLGWTASVLGLGSEGADQLEAGPPAVAFVVLPAIAAAGWLIATWRYRRADVD